jgi:signal transduction histidine kinase
MLSGPDKRIPLRGSHDEWDRVAENLNLMLDRIETLMGEVKQVSDNVAHDLRTPLTRMRGRLEKAYHSQRSAELDQSLIGDTITDLDAVLRIFSSITRIAQIEAQARKGGFRNVNLVEIAGEVVELYDAAAEQNGTRLSLSGDREVLVTGDRDLLFDAIANLVDNAIKHGRPGGHVVVTSEYADRCPVISIADDGPGIPADQHEQVFKRFYRLEQSRYASGNGLGLSLVAAVARLHGARIEMLDNSPGLHCRLWFSVPSCQQVK